MIFNNKYIRVNSKKELNIILLIIGSFKIFTIPQLNNISDRRYDWYSSPKILYFRADKIGILLGDYNDEYLLSQQLNKFTLEELLDYDSKKQIF